MNIPSVLVADGAIIAGPLVIMLYGVQRGWKMYKAGRRLLALAIGMLGILLGAGIYILAYTTGNVLLPLGVTIVLVIALVARRDWQKYQQQRRERKARKLLERLNELERTRR